MLKRLPLLLLAGAALASAADGHDFGSIGVSSNFRDDIWIGGAPPGTKAFARLILPSLQGCGLGPCSKFVRLSEIMTSTNADASASTRIDITGHAVSVSGLVITMRVAFDLDDLGAGSVSGERTLDAAGEHSWEWLGPDASPNARWLPIGSYRFETSSPMEAERAIPELPSWALFGVGCAALGCAVARGRHRFPGWAPLTGCAAPPCSIR